ncbi:ABC transporter permease [Streptomyces indicus]|uniref:Peptide/nickel transport system permease protein n=1 Tax=Streptomyces indicus TaxID=417292 RepID=A0A1G8YIN1_9ACTN|nr:ABC transporter permease [Streptomyces indicus]SDK02045.1 peptide/nickel transport system permease protein [Streptomyces indicus]
MAEAAVVTEPGPKARAAAGRSRSPWLAFALRRAVGLAGVLITLVVGTFLMVKLMPGDPAQARLGANATPEQLAQTRQEMGLDQPVLTQFTDYVGGLLRGDLGESFQTGQPVGKMIGDGMPFTAQLALMAMVLVLVLSVPLGMAVAVACRGGRRRSLDTAFTSATAFAQAIPEYVLGTLLVALFAVKLAWLPPSGAATLSAMVLPVLAVSIGPVCTLARIVRRETSAVLTMDYLRTARGRRLRGLRLYARHALPNLLTSTLTVGGLILVGLLGGTVIVESVFAWPGVGLASFKAIIARDYPVIQGMVLVIGLLAALLNLLVDVVLGLLDPRTLNAKAGNTA